MQKIRFRMKIEWIQELLRGKKIHYHEWDKQHNIEVEILPPQEGIFITSEELEIIISDRTNIVNRLLKLMEE